MTLLRAAKVGLLEAACRSGVNRMVLNSLWRAHRLLIICWHAVSVDDEHNWNPGLFISQEKFASRLQLLKAMNCNVLPLGEALVRLREGHLPPRSVVLTIDDGDSSVYLRSWPMLKEFGFPATLYWTTYYSMCRLAVFDPMVQYLLWKGREQILRLRTPPIDRELLTLRDRQRVFGEIYHYAKVNAWAADRKEEFLEELAQALRIDYERIKSRRILHLIAPEEARSMVEQGLDLQLHGHRHRVPRNLSGFNAELDDNARVLQGATSAKPVHFCYPSGSFQPEFASWLRAWGINSATTCQPGLVRRGSDVYFLPRFVDHEGIGASEFAGWISGMAACLSRVQVMDQHGFQ